MGNARRTAHVASDDGSDFDEVSAVLADALDHFNVRPAEKEEVLGACEAHKPQVTAGSTART